MPPDPTQPFPFPPGYWDDLRNTLGAKSIQDYIKIFLRRRQERPGGKFASADIQEIMRLAEDVREVHRFEIQFLRGLASTHPDYFLDEAQRQLLRTYADTHEKLKQARQDDFVKAILQIGTLPFYRQPEASEFIDLAQDLSEAVRGSEAFLAQHGTFDPTLIGEVNSIARQLGTLLEGFTLSDIDEPGKDARKAHLRDISNFLRRLVGTTDHESQWRDGRWSNWNRDVKVYPEKYANPERREAMVDLLQRNGSLRMVAGGHAFNISSSMGGTRDEPIGALVTLDDYLLDPTDGGRPRPWIRISDAAARYNLPAQQADRVVHVSAGMRLRDFGRAMWTEGLALPVAGSTDAQSIGGLIATDLHSTGHTDSFLSQQLLQVTALSGGGQVVDFVKDEAIPRGTPGRWRWHDPTDGSARESAWLPLAGALGTAGVVIEAVLKLDAAFNLLKAQQFVPRTWAEENIHLLLDPKQSDPLFAYHHVSFYYAGGDGPQIETVRMNTWKRTQLPVSEGTEIIKTARELFDHVGSAFLPDTLLNLAHMQAPIPGQEPPQGDRWLKELNKRLPLVLPANEAFAQKLFFQHDEIEVGIPLNGRNGSVDYDIFRGAIEDTQILLQEQEFKTIIEVRFTPDTSEALLGPGVGGPTCYIELATPLGEYSKSRIVEVFQLSDRLMRERYRARPHLGKKTSVTFREMANLFGARWEEFQRVRQSMDQHGKFLAEDNPLLKRIFRG